MEVVESGQHTQWGSLRYPVRPGQYTVIGELIQGGGVAGIPRVRNPNPQVVAERVEESTVRYRPSRREAPEGATGEPLILYDPLTGEPLAYFNSEQEARYYLSDRYFNELRDQDRLREGSNGGLPHYRSCTDAGCQEVAWTAEGFRREDQYIAERALRDFVDTVRDVVEAIIDFVRDVVQAVVDFFAGLFDWVQNAAEDIVASIDNDDDDDDDDDEDNDDEDNDDDEWYWGDGD